jgi:CheY-like chemotaxis protein
MAHALLIEDDIFSTLILQEILLANGHTVRLVYDGASALDLITSDQNFEIAVVDLLLPNQIGLAVIRALRQRSSTIAIIGITGESDIAAREGTGDEAALRAGVNAIVKKPISRPELSRQLKILLP